MNIRGIYAAAALCVCVAVFFSACGKNAAVDETTEPTVVTPWSEAQVFSLPQEEPQNEAPKADKQTDTDRILKRIEAANAVYGLFSVSKPQLDKQDSVEVEEGLLFYRVVDPDLDTMEKLRKYVRGFFSEEITQSLLNVGMYEEIKGKLYAVDVGMEAGVNMGTPTVEVTEKTKTSESYRLTFSDALQTSYEYIYAKGADGKWVFTKFHMY